MYVGVVYIGGGEVGAYASKGGEGAYAGDGGVYAGDGHGAYAGNEEGAYAGGRGDRTPLEEQKEKCMAEEKNEEEQQASVFS